MKRCILLLSLAVLASVIATPAFAGVVDCATLVTNLVTNCGFESGDTAGWQLTGNTAFTSVSNAFVHSDSLAMRFGEIGSQSFLEQDIPTVAGGTYDLYFWLANRGGTPSSFAVSWGGVTLYSEVDAASYGYTGFSFSGLAASGAATPLLFTVRQDPSYYYLDDVQVTSPEPGTLAMLFGGLGVALFNRWRQRKTN